MPMHRMIMMMALLAAPAAHAQWLPQWTGVWEREPTDGSVDAVGVHATPDGGLIAGVRFNRSNQVHIAVLRFDNDGSLQWVRGPSDGAVGDFNAIEPLRGGRFAVIGIPRSGARMFVRVHHAGSGELLWMRESSVGLPGDVRQGLHAMAEGALGELLVAVADSATGDYVVLRYAAEGEPLSTWRWHAGPDARVTDIAALADGGVVVTGIGEGLNGGYATVRFDAAGAVRFHDIEPGDRGSPLGPAHVAVDAHGDVLVAGTPEDGQMGVPETTVWKLDADGKRVWERVLGVDAEFPLGRDLKHFRLAANGDVLVVIDGGPHELPHRLVRLASGDGRALWQAPFSFSIGFSEFPPQAIVEAPHGRLLLAGSVSTEHTTFARLLEFTADGTPCRRRDEASLYVVGAATAGPEGWSVLGTTAGPSSVNGALVQRYDAKSSCDDGLADAVFSDGFDFDTRLSAPGRN